MAKRVNIRGGRYQLIEIADRGGMAVVWRATCHGDDGFQRTVAIKQIHSHLASNQIYVDMFSEEARIGAALQNPNIAQVYDFVCENDSYYLIMEWIDGIDLGSLIRHYSSRETLVPWEICAAVGIGVLRALSEAHERLDVHGNSCPVLHRDISPHNILITTRGMVKLIDFGLCMARDRRKELTEPGIVKGKMSYLSPEVVLGNTPTAKSDQFAVGSVLWESLASEKLFDGANDFEVYTKIREGQITSIRSLRRGLPRRITAMLRRALATNPDDRYANTREMGRELSSILDATRATKDLHSLMGKAVIDARSSIPAVSPNSDPSTLTMPAALENTPTHSHPEKQIYKRAITAPIGNPDTSQYQKSGCDTPEASGGKGLLHRLPFWGKRD